MKRIIALMLALMLLLSGCGGKKEAEPPKVEDAQPAPTVAETTEEPTTEPTTEATEPPVYRNPLNGEIIGEPYTDRIFACTISNMQENIPHVNLCKADVVFETYVNMNNIVRCLALYSNIADVEAIGSMRSTRPIFNDLAQHFGLIVAHAGGSHTALDDALERNIENFNVENWDVLQHVTTSYRDKEYKRSLENSLFSIGAGLKEYAEYKGYDTSLSRDYGFRFTEDGVPSGGVDAPEITIHLNYKQAKKDTIMIYDEELGKYAWKQYGKIMQDQISGETEAFTNVLMLSADVTNEGLYPYADFDAGGTGYYACGGKLVPITWTCAGEREPFFFYTEDGQELQISVGNTYIAILPADGAVEY